MNYLDYLNENKRILNMMKNSSASSIEGYTNLRNDTQQKLENLPEDIDRDTTYARKYNQYLADQRSVLGQEISEYEYHIQGEQEELETVNNKLIEIEEEISSIS